MPTNHRTNLSLNDLHALQRRIEKVNGNLEATAETTASTLESHATALKNLDPRIRDLTARQDELETKLRRITADLINGNPLSPYDAM